MRILAIVIAFLGFGGLLFFGLSYFAISDELNSAPDLIHQSAFALQAIMVGQFITISILVLGGGIALYLYLPNDNAADNEIERAFAASEQKRQDEMNKPK